MVVLIVCFVYAQVSAVFVSGEVGKQIRIMLVGFHSPLDAVTEVQFCGVHILLKIYQVGLGGFIVVLAFMVELVDLLAQFLNFGVKFIKSGPLRLRFE